MFVSKDLWDVQSKEYQRGFQNALSHLQKQYNLRNRNVPVTLTQKRQNLQKDAPSKETTPAGQNKYKDIVIMNQDRTDEASTSNVRKDKEFQTESRRKEPQDKGQT